MADNDRQPVTYEEAAQRLGVSVRTVQRRVRGGQLATVSDNGRQYVVLPAMSDQSDNVSPARQSSSGESSQRRENVVPERQADDPRIAALEARVAELEADRDMWRTMSAKLSDTVTEQNRMIAAQMMERGRMIAAETPREAPQAQPVTDNASTPHTWPQRTLQGMERAVDPQHLVSGLPRPVPRRTPATRSDMTTAQSRVFAGVSRSTSDNVSYVRYRKA